MIEALIASMLLMVLIAGLVNVARGRRRAQERQARVDAAAWIAATAAQTDDTAGITVQTIGPWRVAGDDERRSSRRVPAW